VDVVASLCGPMVKQRSGMSPGTWRREDKGTSLGSLPLSLLNYEHFMFN
jgi:hypothetical protein